MLAEVQRTLKYWSCMNTIGILSQNVYINIHLDSYTFINCVWNMVGNFLQRAGGLCGWGSAPNSPCKCSVLLWFCRESEWQVLDLGVSRFLSIVIAALWFSEGICPFHFCLVFKVAENLVSLGISCDAVGAWVTLEAPGSGNQFPRHKSSFGYNKLAVWWAALAAIDVWLTVEKSLISPPSQQASCLLRILCPWSFVISSSGPCMVCEAVCASGLRLRLWDSWWTGVWHRSLQSLEHWRRGWSARGLF